MNVINKTFLVVGLLASAYSAHAMERPIIMRTKQQDLKDFIIRLSREAQAGDFDRYFALLATQPLEEQKRLCNVSLDPYTGRRAVHFAAWQGNAEVLRKLAALGANIGISDDCQRTPFLYAIRKGDLSTVSFFFENGASRGDTDNQGMNAFHLAAIHSNIDAIHVLVRKRALSVTDAPLNAHTKKDGDTPLHLAAFNGHVTAMRALIDNGAQKDAKNHEGANALHLAAEAGQSAAALSLIIDHGFDPNARAKAGETPLHKACGQGAIEIVAALIRNGACTDVVNLIGYSILHTAALNNNGAVIAYLINDHGLNPNPLCDLRLNPFANAETPLGIAIALHNCVAEFTLYCSGGQLTQTESQDRKLQHKGCLTGLKTVADQKIQLAALANGSLAPWDPNSIDPDDLTTPLLRATKRGCFDCVKLLLKDKRTNPNFQYKNGATALHHAVRSFSCSDEMVRYLLNLPHINVTLKDGGRTAREVTASLARVSLLKLFDLRTMRFKLYLSLKNARCSEQCTEANCSHVIHFPPEICKKIAGMLTVDSLPKTSS